MSVTLSTIMYLRLGLLNHAHSGQGRGEKKRVERTVSASGIFITSFQISIQCGLIASPRSLESFHSSAARIIFNIIFNPTPIVPRDACFKCEDKKRRENSYDFNYSRKLALAVWTQRVGIDRFFKIDCLRFYFNTIQYIYAHRTQELAPPECDPPLTPSESPARAPPGRTYTLLHAPSLNILLFSTTLES